MSYTDRFGARDFGDCVIKGIGLDGEVCAPQTEPFEPESDLYAPVKLVYDERLHIDVVLVLAERLLERLRADFGEPPY